MLANHHNLLELIERFNKLDDQTKAWPLMLTPLPDRNLYPDRIANKDRTDKPQTIIAIGHGQFIDRDCSQTDGDAEHQGAMRDPFAEWLRFAPFLVHMMWEKIAGLPGMQNDVCLCDSAPRRTPAVIDGVVFKM